MEVPSIEIGLNVIGYLSHKANSLLSGLFGVRVVRCPQPTSHEAWYNYDKRHELEAINAVRTIERFNGQKLSSRQKKLADEYSVRVLGKEAYAPWLYVYTLIRGTFNEGWIPDNFFGKVVVPKLNKELRSVTKAKTFSNVVLKTEALPDIAYFIDGVCYSRDLTIIDITDLQQMVSETGSHVFVKKDGSGRGRGVVKLATKDINEDAIKSIGNCVIQAPIKQHEFFEKIIADSVATVRITTVRNANGIIEMRASYLRLGRKDTEWVQSDNSVRIAIIERNGELDTFGYTQDWRKWPRHPDTNFTFRSQRVPQFREAVDYCTNLHALVPHLGIIGWDITIGHDDKLKLLEWNGDHCDIKFSEAVIGPCFTGLSWEKFEE